MSEKEMKYQTMSEFMECLRVFEKEISCDGKRTGSHTYPSRVRFMNEEWDEYELVDIEPDMHTGCGCWVGMTFVIRKCEVQED